MEAENVRNITKRPILTRFPLGLYGFKRICLLTWCLHSLVTGDQGKAHFLALELLFFSQHLLFSEWLFLLKLPKAFCFKGVSNFRSSCLSEKAGG